MIPQARVTDKTFGCGSHGIPKCCGHCFGGTHIEGSPDTFVNNLALVRAPGDLGSHQCPHCGTNITVSGSPDTFTNNLMNHRLGDSIDEICGSGKTTTGSPDTFTN